MPPHSPATEVNPVIGAFQEELHCYREKDVKGAWGSSSLGFDLPGFA